LLKILINQTDRFYCHAEPKGEASGFSKRKPIFSLARFFASLRFARNDKSIYVFANKRLINNNVSKNGQFELINSHSLASSIQSLRGNDTKNRSF